MYPWRCGWRWSGTATARWGTELGGPRSSREANAAVEASTLASAIIGARRVLQGTSANVEWSAVMSAVTTKHKLAKSCTIKNNNKKCVIRHSFPEN